MMPDKNSDVLLIMPPPWGIEIPPLGIACLSSCLKEEDIAVKVFDFNIELYNAAAEKYRYLWGMNHADKWHSEEYSTIRRELDAYIAPLIEKILHIPQKIIGFSVPTNCSDLILEEIIRRIKREDAKKIVILGGTSISIKEQRMDLLTRIGEFVDYCVIGEGEEVFFELVKLILAGKFSDAKNIKGVLSNGQFDIEKKKAEMKDWSKYPFPSFDNFNLEKYARQGKSLPIEFSRGCIGNCPFCDFKSVFTHFKRKSPYTILNQIKFYLEKHKIDHLNVVDSSINGDMDNLEKVCDLLSGNDIKVRISSLAIPRNEMNYRLLLKMKKAGFYRLEYGVESGSNNILKAMRKIFNIETAERVIRDTHKAGIETHLYLIVGYPGETEQDFNATKEFLKRNVAYITMIKSINPLYVMAGSEMFSNATRYNIILPQKNSDKCWHTINNDNSYDVRKNRVMELKSLAQDIDISFTEEAELAEFSLLNKLND